MKPATEYQEQKALFKWAAARSATLPSLRLLFAVPNGGQRSIITAKRLKDTGTKRGVPDIFLAVPRNGKHGMFIEMKAQCGKMSTDQHEWCKALVEQGYAVYLCYGWEQASNAILRYLGEMK